MLISGDAAESQPLSVVEETDTGEETTIGGDEEEGGGGDQQGQK